MSVCDLQHKAIIGRSPMDGRTSKPGYWSGIAARYHALSPPLRISASEIAIYAQLASKWLTADPPPRVLVLGATPDFYHLPWPEQTSLLAVDRSAEMLDQVWPGNAAQSLRHDWATMDLPANSRDLALCDGGLSFFRYPHELQQLAGNLRRIITPGGLFVVRVYVDAAHRESTADIFAELKAGQIRNNCELKLRLWFALNPTDGSGVKLDDVWQCFHAAFPTPEVLTRTPHWPDPETESMNAYKDMQDIYYFPSVRQVSEIFSHSGSGFTLEANITPVGPCHQHLKILSFRRSD
jgi:SAM-dependent methyltransferase